MPVSLNRAGARNGPRIREAARLLIESDRTGALARFREFAERSVFSTNVSADKIQLFDAHGAILDGRAIEQARTAEIESRVCAPSGTGRPGTSLAACASRQSGITAAASSTAP